MIYEALLRLCGNLKGFLPTCYMTSAVLPKGRNGLSVLLVTQEAFLEFVDTPSTIEVPVKSNIPLNSEDPNIIKITENEIPTQELGFSLIEIFNTSLPYSSEVNDLNKIIVSVKNNQSISRLNSESPNLSEAIFLISNLLETHWNDFPVGAKVLILKKLYPLRDSKIIYFKFIAQLIFNVLNPKNRAWKQIADYQAYDLNTKKQIDEQVIEEFQLLLSNFNRFQKVCQSIFKKEGFLLKENNKKIHKFVRNLKEYKDIIDCESEDREIINLSEQDYEFLIKSPPTIPNESLIANINWYKNLMNKN